MIEKTIEKILDGVLENLGVNRWYTHHLINFPGYNELTIVSVTNDEYENEYIHDAILELTHELREQKKKGIMVERIFEVLEENHIYGYALCSKNDEFDKQIGCIVAKGRLIRRLTTQPQSRRKYYLDA